ncbi:MFS transporter [Streptomyces antimicrobicus]|uniref:MFS transporter n=1 Tax=Streptomyces antimicrobicus TaxID=2883108 RepID=A0ABS8B353_9ACTN|nr:MFS transporter [Streptomyces antimicrobicus]MCB5179019.1 MFS transporter [Streptomyces antimicrobicus]
MNASLPTAVTAIAFLARAGQLGLFSAEVLILLDRQVGEDRIGLVMAAAAAGGALAQLAAGRWGHRVRATRMTLLGTGLQSAGCLVFATPASWPVLAGADFLLMAGSALTSTGLRATLAAPPPGGREPGPGALERAYGRLTAAQMLGALAGPLGAGAVLVHGTAWAAWAATAVTLAATAVAGAADRRRGSLPAPPVAARPPGPGPDRRPDGPAGPAAPLWPLWPLLVLLFGITALYGGYAVVWAVYLRELGAQDLLIAWSAACLALPALVLSPRAGAVLPRVPRTRLIRCAALVLGACACLYPLLGSVAAALALSLAEGVLLAVALPLVSAQVARRAPEGRTARAFGLLGTADALGSGVGTALGGALLAQGGAGEAFRFSGLLCLLCAAASALPVRLRPPAPDAAPSPSPSPSPSPCASSSPSSLSSSSSSSSSSSEIGRSPHVSRPSP